MEEMVKETKLDEMTYEEHSHTPYALLYLIALEKWRQKYGTEKFPDSYKERKSFEEVSFGNYEFFDCNACHGVIPFYGILKCFFLMSWAAAVWTSK